MSTDSNSSSSDSPDASPSHGRTSGTRDTAERLREPTFVGLAVLGTLVLAIGIAFLILSVTMDTTPPAPYFTTLTQKYIVVAGSLVTAAAGVGLLKLASRFAGW